jgi:hypothetical protein
VPTAQKNTPAFPHVGAGPTQEHPLASLWQVCPPGHPPFGAHVWGAGPLPQSMMVVVVQRFSGRVVVVVVVVAGTKGAQSSFGGPAVTVWVPNWSVPVIAGSVAFGHFAL